MKIYLFALISFIAISTVIAENVDQILNQQATAECRANLEKLDPRTNRCRDFISCCEDLCGARRAKANCSYSKPSRDKPSYAAQCICGTLTNTDKRCMSEAVNAPIGKDQCSKFVDCCQGVCKGNGKNRVDCSVRSKVIYAPRTTCTCAGGAASVAAWGALVIFALATLRFA